MKHSHRKLKITFISHIYLPNVGGLEKTLYHLSDEIKKDGHEINFIVPRDPPETPLFEIINNIPVHRIEAPRMLVNIGKKPTFTEIHLRTKAAIRNFFIMYRILRSWKPDIVHIHNLHNLMTYTLLLSWVCRFKLIVSLQGYPVLELPFLPRHNRWIFKMILRRAHYVTACSECMLRDTVAMVPAIKKRSVAIHNGIDLSEFTKTDAYRHTKPYILSVANLHWYKGTDILLMAFSKIANRFNDIDLILIGDGSYGNHHLNLAQLLGIKSRVCFTGQIVDRSTIIKVINGCEFFVLPSRYEPFGIANLEAMAAGKAVITTDAGGCPEIVKNRVNGIVVKAKSDTALAEAMAALIEDKKVREEYGKAGKHMVEAFTWEKIYKQYLDMYNKVTKESKRSCIPKNTKTATFISH